MSDPRFWIHGFEVSEAEYIAYNAAIDFDNLDTNTIVKQRIARAASYYRPEHFAQEVGRIRRALDVSPATDELDAFFLRSCGIEVNISPEEGI